MHRLRGRPDLPDQAGAARMTTIGEALISLLEQHGVDTVFGIPGVHTVELYRGLAGVEDPPCHAAPRTGRGLHGRRLCARLGQARRRFRDHRAGADQHDHRDGAGARRFRADAGDLRRQRHRHPGQGSRLSARTARPARHDGKGGAVFSSRHRSRRTADGARSGFRAVLDVAARPGPYRNPDRRHGLCRRMPSRRSGSPMFRRLRPQGRSKRRQA